MRRSVIAIVALVVTMMLLCTTAGAGKKQKAPIVPEEKIVLWNGKDFAGWKLWVQDENFDVNKVWSVKDGVFRCEGQPTGYMRTETDYADYLCTSNGAGPRRAATAVYFFTRTVLTRSGPKISKHSCSRARQAT